MTKEIYDTKRAELLAQAQAAIDAGETESATSITDSIESLDAEFENSCKLQANLNALNKTGTTPIVDAIVKGNENNMENVEIKTQNGLYNSVEYRTAFMKNVLAKEPIPAQYSNANANTKTSDVSAVIPTTILQRIVEKIEEHGQIISKVTNTSYKGGVSVPTSSAKPSASWVSEGATSDKQKKTTGSITFSYYKLRCAISVSLEVDTVSLDFFETIFVNQVTEAMVAAIETAIISGNGTGKPKGILAETVVTGQNVDITKAGTLTYAKLWDAVKAVPSGYRTSVSWVMNYSTFCDIQAMVDTAGQPIARVNYGLTSGAQATILGIPVVFSDDVSAYAAAPSSDTVVAFLFNLSDYLLNTSYQMTVKQYEDNDTEDKVTKAVMLVDGKVIDKNSLVTITKKSA